KHYPYSLTFVGTDAHFAALLSSPTCHLRACIPSQVQLTPVSSCHHPLLPHCSRRRRAHPFQSCTPPRVTLRSRLANQLPSICVTATFVESPASSQLVTSPHSRCRRAPIPHSNTCMSIIMSASRECSPRSLCYAVE
ncbi:hypothetical protein BD779DRAFT_1523856, partial [Infundibulicybe gibba]